MSQQEGHPRVDGVVAVTEKDVQAASDAPLGTEKGGSIDMEGFVRHVRYWNPDFKEGTPTTWRKAAFKNCLSL